MPVYNLIAVYGHCKGNPIFLFHFYHFLLFTIFHLYPLERFDFRCSKISWTTVGSPSNNIPGAPYPHTEISYRVVYRWPLITRGSLEYSLWIPLVRCAF
jgi:hypothetical protein